MRSSFSKFMRNVRKSSLTISGFDNSTQSADNKGESSMYFMQTDRSVPLGSTDQGVDNFVFDTVDDLQSNLFSVSDYYEEGADIHLTHNGFSGIEGTNPRTGKAFQIPCVFTKTLGIDDISRLSPGLKGYGPLPPIPEAMPT